MTFRPLFLPLRALIFLGMAHKPPCSIRFYSVANPKDGPPFIRTIQVGDPPRTVYVSKMPAITEGDIASVFPFQSKDGTFGCGLKLNYDGTLRLDTMSAENKGQPLICIVNGRVVTVLMIDRQIKDGILFIGSGLTPVDVEVIRKRFPVMGEGKGHKKHHEDARPEELPAATDAELSRYSRGD